MRTVLRKTVCMVWHFGNLLRSHLQSRRVWRDSISYLCVLSIMLLVCLNCWGVFCSWECQYCLATITSSWYCKFVHPLWVNSLGKRPKGRPKKRWIDNIKDMKQKAASHCEKSKFVIFHVLWGVLMISNMIELCCSASVKNNEFYLHKVSLIAHKSARKSYCEAECSLCVAA